MRYYLKNKLMLKRLFKFLKFVLFYSLNRNNSLAALWRIISFQIVSRIINNPILLPYVNNIYLLTKYVKTGATYNWNYGLSKYEN